MHVLLTNDDGVMAPGLAALAKAFGRVHKTTILAPDRNWSASGHVKTMHRPMLVWETELADGTPALTTDGTPSDCVALAVLGIVPDPIDMVISGINPLANLGHDVTYSGTVSAAMEATISGLMGIAISLDTPEEHKDQLDYGPAAEITLRLADQIFMRGLPKGVFLNINIPYQSVEELAGILITKQGQRVYRDALVHRKDPRGRSYYWIGGDAPTGVLEPDTDFLALTESYVSITPLQLDLTAHRHRSTIAEWDLKL
ncbi:MAG: 5'/3'-nucleotidase SurE [Chloroflexi bacterium RBG_16_48_8]|nr:MAG: 5'/3'-nucleotidase SurE [Chloroflexi bacterium RBG_16_48_8]